jgi:hypothetical protein
MAFAQVPTYTNQITTSGLDPLSGRILDVLDFNKDGFDDVIYQNGSNPWKLMKNNGDVTFTDQTVANGLPNDISFSNVLSTDFNNDGNWDLLTWSNGTLRFFTSNSSSFFTEQTISFGAISFSNGDLINESNLTLSDYNNDGDNDILLTRKLISGERRITALDNQIDLNNGFVFVDLISGISANINPVFATIDIDNDMDDDLLICMKTISGGIGNTGTFTLHSLNLFKNNNSVFVDITSASGLGTINTNHFGFANIVDLNNDGNMDILVGTADATYPNYTNNGNRYLKNNGNNTFTDITSQINLYSVYGYYHNSTLADLNNDGNNEIIWEYSQAPGEMRPIVFGINGLTYGDVTTSFSFNTIGYPNGSGGYLNGACSIFDVNNDGKLDVFYGQSTPYNAILRINNSLDSNNYLKINLSGCGKSDPRGTKVSLFQNGISSSKFYGTNNGSSNYIYNKSDNETLHFGLGSNTSVDSIYIFYTGGIIKKVYNVSANQTLSLSSNDFAVDAHTVCSSYTWPLNGQTYLSLIHI